uniref:DUF1127 domain-containing protein n=1 Tax=Pseudomonas sp. TTU2014-080ASC TaxID=1729724 RepID=UPI0009E870BB|nr:DUF1127 domain-containing protein [Pseudomonas sp. TTU2014-080ASC]
MVVCAPRPLAFRRIWRRVRTVVACWRHNVRSRRQLASLDQRLLSDTGISQAQRQMELTKPFWR